MGTRIKKKEKKPYRPVKKNKVIKPIRTAALTRQPKHIERGRPEMVEEDLPLDRENFVEMIIKCGGLVKYIALALRVSRQTIYTWMDIFPWIKDAMKDAREDTLDLTEHVIKKNIRKGKEYTSTWYANTIGRHRGFMPKQMIIHAKNQFEELDDAGLDKRIKEEQDRLTLCDAGETKKT